MSGIKTYTQTDLKVKPTESTHIVRLQDMTAFVDGLFKDYVAAVMVAPFDATYNSTALTLTQNTPETLVVDGVTLRSDDRVLLTNQMDSAENGIYTVTTLGVDDTTAAVLTRSSDFNTNLAILNGLIVPVSQGDVFANSRWQLMVSGFPYVLGATSLIFNRVDSGGSQNNNILEKNFVLYGSDSITEYVFNHNLNTKNITCDLYDSVTGETVIAGIRRKDYNTVEILIDTPLGLGVDLYLFIRAVEVL